MAIRRGLTYPLTIKNGSLSLSEDADLVAEAIYSVLETRPGERVLRPRYGLPNFVLDSTSNRFVITSRIEVALTDQVADPSSFHVTGDYQEDGTLSVEVHYDLNQVSAPPIPFNLKD